MVSSRSGTFLQSWSNSEQLRVWSQYFLGVRPNLLDGVLVVAPRIPSELNNVETTVAIGCGRLEYVFKRYDGKQYLSLTLSGQKSVDLVIDNYRWSQKIVDAAEPRGEYACCKQQ